MNYDEYGCPRSTDYAEAKLDAYVRLLTQLDDSVIGSLLEKTDKNPAMFNSDEKNAIRKEAVSRLKNSNSK